jgi:hypothetical protein
MDFPLADIFTGDSGARRRLIIALLELLQRKNLPIKRLKYPLFGK